MISRTLIAALVGLSVATGTLGAASAQTADKPMTRQSAPVTAGEPTAPSAAKPATVKAHHNARMHKATHRKHVAHRAAKGTTVAKHSTKRVATKSTGKRVHVSRNTKHPTKHA